MPRHRLLGLRALLLLGAACLATTALADNWPRFRGPNGTGVAADKGVPVKWGAGDVLWKVELPGLGHSSPVVWGDRLFLESSGAKGNGRALLPSAAVPAGFVYIGAGELWFGDGDEQLRTQFLDTAPLHRRATDGYLIARNEVTFREWIAFLTAAPASERPLLSPRAGSTRGSVQLREDEGGWQLVFQPATQRYTARAGEAIVYAGRKAMARQDWLDFPVTGVSAQDAQRYLSWLRATGRVPNARLCTELEWERAARGADDRVYPNGDQLRPQDANFDLTYGRLGSAYGPDVVGSHPATRSPFGVDDLVGNALELVASSLGAEDELLVRGGAYFFGAASCRSTNREIVPATLRDATIGFRVCATPGEIH